MPFDMLDYMANDHGADQWLDDWASHPMKTFRRDHPAGVVQVLVIKSQAGYPFEVFEVVTDPVTGVEWIALKYESGVTGCEAASTWNRDDFRFWDSGDYRWTRRFVDDGDVFLTGEDEYHHQFHNWIDAAGVEHRRRWDLYNYPVRVELVSALQLYGDLGVRSDVVALSHHWQTRNADDLANREIYFYDREFGLVKWAWVEAGETRAQAFFSTIHDGAFIEAGRWPMDTIGYTPCDGNIVSAASESARRQFGRVVGVRR